MALRPGAALSGGDRVRDMLRRLERRCEQAALGGPPAAALLDLLANLLEQRARAFGDEHFETLHPARTLLILMDDCDVADAELLLAAATIESEHPSLRPPPANALAASVPLPDRTGEALLEELVAASLPARLVALAERLDHARHLHLREQAVWRDFHRVVGSVYAPVAARTHPRLERRYDWWWRTFRRRFLEPPPTA